MTTTSVFVLSEYTTNNATPFEKQRGGDIFFCLGCEFKKCCKKYKKGTRCKKCPKR